MKYYKFFWHKVDDEPSHLNKTETLLSPRDVVCPADNPLGRNSNRTSQLHHKSYTVKNPPSYAYSQSLAQSNHQRNLTPIPWAGSGRNDRNVWTSGH